MCGWENGVEERNGGFFRRYGGYVLIGIGVLLALLLWLWWFVQPDGFDQKISFLRLAGTVLGGAALVGGLLINFWGQWINQKIQDENQKQQIENQGLSLQQLQNAQEQMALTRRGQITERFSRAIDQLGSAPGDPARRDLRPRKDRSRRSRLPLADHGDLDHLRPATRSSTL